MCFCDLYRFPAEVTFNWDRFIPDERNKLGSTLLLFYRKFVGISVQVRDVNTFITLSLIPSPNQTKYAQMQTAEFFQQWLRTGKLKHKSNSSCEEKHDRNKCGVHDSLNTIMR